MTEQNCPYVGAKIYPGSVGYICIVDKSSCFFSDKPDIVKTCPVYIVCQRREKVLA